MRDITMEDINHALWFFAQSRGKAAEVAVMAIKDLIRDMDNERVGC